MILDLPVSGLVHRYGSPHTIRKDAKAAGANAWTAGAPSITYHACRAKERGFKSHEIKGTVQSGDTLIVIDASSLPSEASAPAKGDRIADGVFISDNAADWRTIVDVYAAKIAGNVVSYRVHVR